MDEFPPTFPNVDNAVLQSIINFARSTIEWLETDAARAAEQGHDPSTHAANISGWQFVAEALVEQL